MTVPSLVRKMAVKHVILVVSLCILLQVVEVSAQCTITPLNPNTLTATGGTVVNGTTNVRIRCVCPITNDGQRVRWYDINTKFLNRDTHINYVTGSPYYIPSTTNPNTDVTLVIPTFNDSYDGTYNCGIRVTNTLFTSPSAAVTLTIGLPVVTVMPSSQSVEVTHNATFTTMVTGVGSSKLFFQWRHNGTIISGETGDTLKIANVMESNNGHYECIVTTQFGYINVPNVVVLIVTKRLPVIKEQPMDMKINLLNNFTNVSLTCEADGASSYNWERQNDIIPSDSTGVNTNTLTLINLQPEDAGNYRCVATNASGSSESSYATITISAFPLVDSHPTDTSAAAPFSAIFRCSIQAYGYLTVTWYRSNTYPVPEKAYSTLIPSVNVTTSILTIPNVTSGDVGTYCCVAAVDRITIKSLSANLFLSDLPSPPVVMTAPVVNLTVNNYNLTMKCLPYNSNFNYKWIKKNDILPLRAQGVDTSQLTIVNLTPEDSGDYQCVMSNSTGTIGSNFSTVKVIVSPPAITKQPTDEVVGVYSSITFGCKVQGYGYIDVQWRKLGSALPITAVVDNTNLTNKVSSIIKIMNLVGYHGGMYYCVAVNIAGQTSSIYAKLSVLVPCAEIIKPYKNVTVVANQNANLHCLASSCGALTYDWIKYASNLSTSAVKSYVTKQFLYYVQIVLTYQLTIPNVQLSDEGWYCCMATNECGTTKRCIWLEVKTIPNITQQPISVILRENSEQVSTLWCLANGLEPLSYLWQIYQPSTGSWSRPSVRAINITSPELVFSKLTEEDEGIYRCVVFNDDGNVVSDNATIALYGPPEITFISSDMTYLENSKARLICNATNDADAVEQITFAWFYKNITSLYQIIPDNSRVIIYNKEISFVSQSQLLFDPINRKDEGVYICRASNHLLSYTESSTKVMIQRVCPPLQDPVNGKVIVQGNTAIFACFDGTAVIGNPIIACNNGTWNRPPPTCKLLSP